MKKILPVFFLLSASALYAQTTTCEMRVDAHQSASTTQRVDYCLNAPQVLDPMDNAEVIYYGVVTQQQAADPKEEKNTAKDGYYDGTKKEVARGYMGTRKFPAFTNDNLSESEREYQRKHLQQAKEEIARKRAAEIAAAQQAEQQKAAALVAKAQPAPQEVQVVTAVQEEVVAEAAVKETKKGVLSRQKKPARFDKQQAEPEVAADVQPVAQDTAYPTSPDYQTQEPAYPTSPDYQTQEPSYPTSPAYEPQEQAAYPDGNDYNDNDNVPGETYYPAQMTPAAQPAAQTGTTEYNPYYESGVAVTAPVTYDQISQN